MSRTEALQVALAAVWSGADELDAEAVLDHLADQGFDVVDMSAKRAASKRGAFDEVPPAASTQSLSKRRTA
jgi:hypothetical protein